MWSFTRQGRTQLHALHEREAALHFGNDTHLVAILQVFAHARQLDLDRYTVSLQLLSRPDTGQLEKLRRIERARAKDYFSRRRSGESLRRAVRQVARVGAIQALAGKIFDAGGAMALVQHHSGC